MYRIHSFSDQLIVTANIAYSISNTIQKPTAYVKETINISNNPTIFESHITI